MNIVQKLKREWFLVMMLVMIFIAILEPQIGRSAGILKLDGVTTFGITLIFFLYGIKLSPKALMKSVLDWRLHLFIQLVTFALYPLLWLLFSQGFLAIMPIGLAFGFCYLLALPSTISSSVAMTAVAKGNVPGAIFNASLSNVLGIIITPFLIQYFMGVSGHSMPLMDVIIDITLLLLAPLIAGQLCRPLLISFYEKNAAWIGFIDKLIILFIVLNVFSDSVHQGIWQEFSLQSLLITLVLCAVILLFVSQFIRYLAKWLHFETADEIAIVFCGTKKTLLAGVPMAKVIFDGDPRLGMILLPIMIYHPLQIFYSAYLAKAYLRRKT